MTTQAPVLKVDHLENVLDAGIRQVLPYDGLVAYYYDSISKIDAGTWSLFAPSDNIFLSHEYARILDEATPTGMAFMYVLITQYDQPVGIASLQRQGFQAAENIQNENVKDCFFSNVSNYLKQVVKKQVEFTAIACGNLLVSGEHGFWFRPNVLQVGTITDCVTDICVCARDILLKRGIESHFYLLKDFRSEDFPSAQQLDESRYFKFQVQPTMELEINNRWSSTEEYLAAMTSKYRTRYKRARKKGAGLRHQELSLEDLIQYRDIKYNLYLEIARGIGFNLVNLHPKYDETLKSILGDRFRAYAYFDAENTMVAYYTTIDNGRELEAHFLGLNAEVNKQTQSYLNILYNLAEQAIEGGYEVLNYGRTALEIKSSVGAESHDLVVYMRHAKSFSNRFVKGLFNFLNVEEPYTPRHPFKSN